MKCPITWLPSLMVFGFVAALAAQTPVATTTDTNAQRASKIRELRQELKVISDRLKQLEAEGHQYVPRGGLSPSAELPADPAATPANAPPTEVAATAPVLTAQDPQTLSFSEAPQSTPVWMGTTPTTSMHL